jgi:hypothetical protein
MIHKTKDEMHLRPFKSIMNDDTKLFLKLTTLTSNIKLEVFGLLDYFISRNQLKCNLSIYNYMWLVVVCD